jgi:hypothetical protein
MDLELSKNEKLNKDYFEEGTKALNHSNSTIDHHAHTGKSVRFNKSSKPPKPDKY